MSSLVQGMLGKEIFAAFCCLLGHTTFLIEELLYYFFVYIFIVE